MVCSARAQTWSALLGRESALICSAASLVGRKSGRAQVWSALLGLAGTCSSKAARVCSNLLVQTRLDALGLARPSPLGRAWTGLLVQTHLVVLGLARLSLLGLARTCSTRPCSDLLVPTLFKRYDDSLALISFGHAQPITWLADSTLQHYSVLLWCEPARSCSDVSLLSPAPTRVCSVASLLCPAPARACSVLLRCEFTRPRT